MHDLNQTEASVASDLEPGSRQPSSTPPLTQASASPSNLPTFRQNILLPSPPCSPPRSSGDGQPATASTPTRGATGAASMLQAPSTVSTAKLDISLLLKSSPSPPPSSSGAEGHRASSVPPQSTQHFTPTISQHRPSISSSAATTQSYQTPHPTAAAPLTLEQQQRQFPHAQPQYPRPYLPSLTTATFIPLGHPGSNPPSTHGSGASPQQQTSSSSLHPSAKRPPPESPHPAASPAKRQSKWTPEEDALIIELRGSGMKWEEISKRLPGRSAISCRLHYQNYLERRSEWDEERKNRLARLYERLKSEMWGPLAAELGIPWRAAEAMHWQLGEADMARRAGVVPFSLATTATATPSSSASDYPPGVVPSTARYVHGVPEGVLVHHAPLPPNLPPGAMPMGEGPMTRFGRSGSQGSLGRRGDEGGPELVEAGRPPSGQGQGLLPSLAELERGITVYDDRQRRMQEPPGPGYGGRGGRRYTDPRQMP